MANQKVRVKTGEIIKVSGIYGRVGSTNEEVFSKGDRVPPYKGRAQTLDLKRQAKHAGK